LLLLVVLLLLLLVLVLVVLVFIKNLILVIIKIICAPVNLLPKKILKLAELKPHLVGSTSS